MVRALAEYVVPVCLSFFGVLDSFSEGFDFPLWFPILESEAKSVFASMEEIGGLIP